MIKKCLFPVAGFGTRFLPATKAAPKEMLPILTKLLLKYAVEEALLKEINAVCNNATFTYVRQKQMLGLGHAILTGEPLIGNEPFAVHLADDLCTSEHDNALTQMIKVYNKYQCSIVAIEQVPMDQTHKYGVIAGDLVDNTNDTYRVTDMIENQHQKMRPLTWPS
jgi:UTP--glucose-1-phosphate uridylyltransferase